MFAYSDANWVGNMGVIINPHHVMFSYWEMILSVGIIKKNTFIVMSSIKVEYMVVSQATKQIMWLPSLFGSIGIT